MTNNIMDFRDAVPAAKTGRPDARGRGRFFALIGSAERGTVVSGQARVWWCSRYCARSQLSVVWRDEHIFNGSNASNAKDGKASQKADRFGG
jgi:hypothetical protein